MIRDNWVGIVIVLAGVGGIVGGIFGRDFFVGDADAISSFSERRSRRSGKTICITVGVLIIACGLKVLLFGQGPQ